MIEVNSAKKVLTPGKERLTAMEGIRQTVTAIPKRKIGMGVTVLFGLVAYIKTLFGGSEVAAQSASEEPLLGDDGAAPICETDNSSADNSGRMSYGNADLFEASARADQDGAAPTLAQSTPSSVLSPSNSSLQPTLPTFQFSSSAAAAPSGTEPGGGTGSVIPPFGGGNGPAGPGGGGGGTTPSPQEDNEPDEQEDDDDLPGVEDDGDQPAEDPVVNQEEEREEEECEKDADCHDATDCGDKDDHSDGSNAHDETSCDDAAEDDYASETCDQHDAANDDCLDDPMMARGDIVYGLDTPDHIEGGEDADLVYGGEGSDDLVGYAGDDFLIGADGNDTVNGGDGDDRIAGGHGEDRLHGGAGDDILTGGLDNDVLQDGHGADLLFGDAGNDTILLADDLEADQVYGGTGDDILDLAASARDAHVDMAAGTVTRADGPTDTFDGIEIFTAGDGAEVFDLSGFFTPSSASVSETVFQIRDFSHEDTLVLADDIRLALSDLQQVDDKRDFKNDGSDFEARITSFEPEAAAEENGRPGFRQDEQDELMIRRIDLRLEQDAGDAEIELWVSSDLGHKQSDDFTS